MTKQHDWMAINLLNDEVDLSDLMANNITPENTSLQDYDYYKNIEDVRQKFTSDKSGEFDEDKYAAFYNSVLSAYNSFTETDYIDLLIDEIEVHPNNWTTPGAKVMDTKVSVKMISDPYKRSMGQAGLWNVGEQPYSVRELAQTQKVVNHLTGEELDWSPNDHAGLFKSLNDPTICIASWDEDGTHIENGEPVKHYKGQYKLKNGQFYYETLGNREAYDKDILRYTDTITVEGSWLNKYDVFDADSLDKSITGTIFRTALSIAPLLIPYVNYAYGMLGAGMAIAEASPTIFKSLNAAITGSNTNDFGKSMTSWENYMYRFKDTESDYSRNRFMTFEKVGQQVSAIGLQLYQQKFIGKAPQFIGKILKSKSLATSKVGQAMSLMFMAATSGADSYALFKRAGVDDRIAGIGTLATIAGFFTLMNNNYYKDALFSDTSWLNESSVMVNSIRNVGDDMLNVAKAAAAGQAPARITRAQAQNMFGQFYKISKKRFKKMFGKGSADEAGEVVERGSSAIRAGETHLVKNAGQAWYSTMLNRATNESLEEMSEEAMQDIIKGIIAGADALGWNVRQDPKEAVDFNFSAQDFFTRYLTAGIGGFVGGSMFEGFEMYEFMLSPQIRRLSDITLSDQERIAYILRENGVEPVLKIIDKLEKKGVWGNKHLSLKPKSYKGIEGKDTVIFEAAKDASDSQNAQVANLLRTFIKSTHATMGRFDMLWNSRKLENFMLPQMLQEAKDMIMKDSAEYQDTRIDKEAEKIIAKSGGDFEEVRAQLYSQYAYADTVITALNQAGFFTSIQDFYTKLGKDLVVAQMDYDAYEAQFFPTDKAKRTEGLEEKWKNDETRKQKEEAIKKLIEKRDALLKGDLNGLFITKALMHANDELLKAWDLNPNTEDEKRSYLARSVANYVKARYGINYDSLGEKAKTYFEDEWKELLTTDMHSKADAIYDIHVQMSKSLGKEIEAITKELYNKKQNKYFSTQLSGGLEQIEKLQVEIDELNNQLAELMAQKAELDKLLPDVLPSNYAKSNDLIKRLNLQDKILVFNTQEEFNAAVNAAGLNMPSEHSANGMVYNGVIYILNDGDDDVIVKRIMHEAVAHFGLKNLVEASGTTMFHAMNNIYNNASPEIQAKINTLGLTYAQAAQDEYNAQIAAGATITLEQVQHAIYTEEYLAKLAEDKSNDLLNESEKTFFDKILDWFTQILDLLTGGTYKIDSEEDLVELLRQSVRSLRVTDINAVPTIVPKFDLGMSMFHQFTRINPNIVEQMTSGTMLPDTMGSNTNTLKIALSTNDNFNSRETISVNSLEELYRIVLGLDTTPITNKGFETNFNTNFIIVSQANLDFEDAMPEYIIINGNSSDAIHLAAKIWEDLEINVLFAEDLNGKFENNSLFRVYDSTTNSWVLNDPTLVAAEDSIKGYHSGSWIPNYKIKERLASGRLDRFSENLFGIKWGETAIVFLYGNVSDDIIQSELSALAAKTPMIVMSPTDVEHTTAGLTLIGNGEFAISDTVVASKIYTSGNAAQIVAENLFSIPIFNQNPSQIETNSVELTEIDNKITQINQEIDTNNRLIHAYETDKMFTFGQRLTKEGAELFNFDKKDVSIVNLLNEIAAFEQYFQEVEAGMVHADNYYYESWRGTIAERLVFYITEKFINAALSGGAWMSSPELVASIKLMMDTEHHSIKSELEDQLKNYEEIRPNIILDEITSKYGIDVMLSEAVNDKLANDAHITEIFKRINALNQIVYAANTRMSDPEAMNRWEPEIITLLKDFNTLMGNGESNYIEMIRRAYSSYEGVQNIQEFSLNSTTDEVEFMQILPVLKALSALLEGMISNPMSIIDSRTGFNEFANLYLSAEEQLPVLKNVDPDILIDQLNILNERLKFLAGLSAQNGSRKIGLNLQMAVDRISDTYRKFEGFAKVHEERFSFHVEIPELWEESGELSYNQLVNPRIDDLEKIVHQGIIFEEKFVKVLLDSGWSSLSAEEKIDTLLEYCNNSLFCGNFGKKEGFPEISLTETSAILYLLSMLEVNTADFNKRLIAAREVTDTKAPFDSQIYAIRIADAFIKSKTENTSLFKMFMERLNTLADDEKGKVNLDDYARTKIKNAIAIYGSAGTGKTSVVAKLISAMNPDAKVFGTAMFEPQRIKLQESTGLDKTQIIDAEALLNSVLPDRNKRDSNNYSVNATLVDRAAVLKGDISLNLHSEFLNKTFDPKNNNIVIIDELTLFSSLDWNILDAIAEKYNITYIALGDEKQNSSKAIRIKGPKSTWWGDASDLKFLTVPTLTASFRTTNFAKDHNLKLLEVGIQQNIDIMKDPSKDWNDMQKLVAEGSQPVVFDYLINDRVYGEYITQSSADFKSVLDKIINLNPDSEIVIVVKDGSEISKYNSYKSEKVKIVSIEHIQGNEGDFFFFDNTYQPKTNDELLWAKYKELYTMISRSKIGTVILDESDSILNELNIKSVEKRDSARETSSSEGQYSDYAENFVKIYGEPSSNPESEVEETSETEPAVRASIKFNGNMKLELDDRQETLINNALDPIVENDVTVYGNGLDYTQNKLYVKFNNGEWGLSFIWEGNEWIPIDYNETVIPNWRDNYILNKLSLKLTNKFKFEDKAWSNIVINPISLSEILTKLKSFVETASVNKYKIKSDSPEDNNRSADEYLGTMRKRQNTFFVDDFNEYINALPHSEKKLGIFNDAVENNDKELSRAYKYISSVARDGIDPNIRIKQWIDSNIKKEFRSIITDALTGEREFYFEKNILYLVAGELKLPIMKINSNTMLQESTYYHGYLTKLKNCRRVTTDGEGVYDNTQFAEDYLMTDPIIVAADNVKLQSIVNIESRAWMKRANGKTFVLLTDSLYEDPKSAWEVSHDWNHAWNPFGSVIGTQRIISISEIIKLSLLTGMIYKSGKFKEYHDLYMKTFGEDIKSPDEAKTHLNQYMGYDMGFIPITDKLEGDGRRKAIKHNYQVLAKKKLLDYENHEKLIAALISELENNPNGFVYNGLHSLVRTNTFVNGAHNKRGGYQLRFGDNKFVLLLERKASRGYDEFGLYIVNNKGSLEKIGITPLSGPKYLQDAIKRAIQYSWDLLLDPQTKSEIAKNNQKGEWIQEQNDLLTIMPVIKTDKGHIVQVSTPEVILALLSDFQNIDVDKLNDDMLSGKYSRFKRGLYMNLIADMYSYIDSNKFYKEYRIDPNNPAPMTSDIVKMIGSIYEAVGSQLFKGRLEETTSETYFDVPNKVKNALRYANIWEKVSSIVTKTQEEWISQANEKLKEDGIQLDSDFKISKFFDTSIFKEVTDQNITVDEENSNQSRIVGTTDNGDYVLALNNGIEWRAIMVSSEIISEITETFNMIPDNINIDGVVKEDIQAVIEEYLSGNVDTRLPRDKQLIPITRVLNKLKKEIEKINCK